MYKTHLYILISTTLLFFNTLLANRQNITPESGFTDGTYSCAINTTYLHPSDMIYTGNTIHFMCTHHDSTHRALLFSYNTSTQSRSHLGTTPDGGSNGYKGFVFLTYDEDYNPLILSPTGGAGIATIFRYSGSLSQFGSTIGSLFTFPTAATTFQNNFYFYLIGADAPGIYTLSGDNSWISTGSIPKNDNESTTLFSHNNQLYTSFKSGSTLEIQVFSGGNRSFVTNKTINNEFIASVNNPIQSDLVYFIIYSGDKSTDPDLELSVLQFTGDTLSYIGDPSFYTTKTSIHNSNQYQLFVDSADHIYIPTLDTSSNHPVILTYFENQRRIINYPIYNSTIRSGDDTNAYQRSLKTLVINNTLYFSSQDTYNNKQPEVRSLDLGYLLTGDITGYHNLSLRTITQSGQTNQYLGNVNTGVDYSSIMSLIIPVYSNTALPTNYIARILGIDFPIQANEQNNINLNIKVFGDCDSSCDSYFNRTISQ